MPSAPNAPSPGPDRRCEGKPFRPKTSQQPISERTNAAAEGSGAAASVKQQGVAWKEHVDTQTDEIGRVKAVKGGGADAATCKLSFDMSACGEQVAKPFLPAVDVISRSANRSSNTTFR